MIEYGLYGLAGGDLSQKRQNDGGFGRCRLWGGDDDGATPAWLTADESLLFEVEEMLVDCGYGGETEVRGHLVEAGSIPVFLCKTGDKIQNLFLALC